MPSGSRLKPLDDPETLRQMKMALTTGPEIRWDGRTPAHVYLWLGFGGGLLGLIWFNKSRMTNNSNRNSNRNEETKNENK